MQVRKWEIERGDVWDGEGGWAKEGRLNIINDLHRHEA